MLRRIDVMRTSLWLVAGLLMMGCTVSSTTPDAGDGAPPEGVDAGGQPDGGDTSDAAPGNDADAGTDASPDVTASCTAPTGAGTQHPSVPTDETWTAAASPHVIPNDLSMYHTITLEPCAVVQIAAGKTITFGVGASIVANGTASQPVTIDALDPQKPWGQMRFIGGTGHFAYTTLAHGGDPLNALPYYAAVLDIRAGSSNLATQVFFDHVTVSDSASQGLYINDGGGIDPASNQLTVKGAKGAAVHTWFNAAGGLPAGSYTGNGVDEITLSGLGCNAESVAVDMTLHDRGVPYHAGFPTNPGILCVSAGQAGKLATLTLEPGVTIKFEKTGVMRIENFQGSNPATGAIVANGTAQKPILFTSAAATPAAGDWLGIWFGEVPAAQNSISFATVEYAGGTSTSGSDSCSYSSSTGVNNDAAIRIFGDPGKEFVTNTTIKDSLNHGFDRGFRTDTKTPDFLPTNTFVNVAKCKQTYQRDVSGVCPTPVPCP
jgi:hypothetical protein